LVIISIGIIWVGYQGSEYATRQRALKAEQKLQDDYENMLKADTYGGKTPEETMDLFIAALENGDIELASKYFVLEKQDQWKERLNDYKARGLLTDFSIEWERIRKTWTKNKSEDVVYFRYINIVKDDTSTILNGQKIKIPAGEYSNNAEFVSYPSGVWKIRVL